MLGAVPTMSQWPCAVKRLASPNQLPDAANLLLGSHGRSRTGSTLRWARAGRSCSSPIRKVWGSKITSSYARSLWRGVSDRWHRPG